MEDSNLRPSRCKRDQARPRVSQYGPIRIWKYPLSSRPMPLQGSYVTLASPGMLLGWDDRVPALLMARDGRAPAPVALPKRVDVLRVVRQGDQDFPREEDVRAQAQAVSRRRENLLRGTRPDSNADSNLGGRQQPPVDGKAASGPIRQPEGRWRMPADVAEQT